MPLLHLEDVAFQWPGQTGFGLQISDFTLEQGEKKLLLGESGSGKSTLLSLVCGTLLPQRGCITLCGQNIAALSGPARDRFRAEHTGIIFQQFNLLPFGSVLDNILLPLRFAPQRRQRVGDFRNEVARLCDALKLPNALLTQNAARLSVGQQQRVAAARALIGGPELIVADEPTSSLDVDTQKAFTDLLFEQINRTGASLLMVSHDRTLAGLFNQVRQMPEIASVESASV